jgi:hypothetical protein
MPTETEHARWLPTTQVACDHMTLGRQSTRIARHRSYIKLKCIKNVCSSCKLLAVQGTTVLKYCKEQYIEASALKLELTALNGLDSIIKSLLESWSETIWGDINIDYLTDDERKEQLDALLLSYNLMATVHFPTRVKNASNMDIDYT